MGRVRASNTFFSSAHLSTTKNIRHFCCVCFSIQYSIQSKFPAATKPRCCWHLVALITWTANLITWRLPSTTASAKMKNVSNVSTFLASRARWLFLFVSTSHTPHIVPCQKTHVKKSSLSMRPRPQHDVFAWITSDREKSFSIACGCVLLRTRWFRLWQRKKIPQQWITDESLFERDSISLTMTMKNCVKLERSSKLSEQDDTKTFRSENSNVHLFSSFQFRLSSSTSA